MDTQKEWIARAMKLEKNLEIKDRRHRLKTYKQCFVGSAAIYVMISLKFATSQQEAIQFGNKLIDLKIIKHVTGRHKFENADLFYVFVDGYNKPQKPSKPAIFIDIKMNLCHASKQISGVNIAINEDEKQNKNKNKQRTPLTPMTPMTPLILQESKSHNPEFKIDDMKNAYVSRKKAKSVLVTQKSASKLNGSEHDALHLFDLILRGSLFYYSWNKQLINDNTQKTLTTYIENYLGGIHNLDNFNLNYFQQLFDDKIKAYIQKQKVIFINIGQVSSLNAELMAYFFDINQNDFKGKLFSNKDRCFECKQNTQFIEIPEIIELNSTQIDLIKDNKFNGDIMFKKFNVSNHRNQIFKFYIKIHRKPDSKFHIFLYLKSKPESYQTVNIMWDFVCEELKFENISKVVELQRNKCDEIEGFAISSVQNIQSSLTFTVNIRIVS